MSDFGHSSNPTGRSPMAPPSPSPQRTFTQRDAPQPGSFQVHQPPSTAINDASINKDLNTIPESARSHKLCIRCPSYPNETYFVDVMPEWNIAQLKGMMSEQFPGQPGVDEMRLIHAGKLLGDEMVVREILNSSSLPTPPTVHLVIKSGSVSLDASSPARPSTAISPSPEDLHSGLRQRKTGLARSDETGEGQASATPTAAPPISTPPATTHFVPNAPAGQPFMHLAVPYQIVMINGIPYAMHPTVFPQPYQPQAGQPHLAAPQQYAPPPNLPAEAAAPVPAPAPVQPAAPVLNAAPGAIGGNVDDEFGDRQRNAPQNPFWLLVKLTFLVYIFSHNSSLTKIILMNLVALVIFLVQTGRLRLIRRHELEAMGYNIGQAYANPNDGQAEGGETDVPSEAQQPSQRSLWTDVKDIAYMFFTSLVPENHEGV
ncbi:uncharacterized protein SPPG_03399 [Spizellomyces punctatus DAOM BR117]|uniref:Ubiquitin-like domain-containing protein n=1 Tax=Spizellomyces punctatus (strain DAOM BR117) TaxID=645134 RepID=A0A0L0HJH4_SPIPD|nr:uncharacterized protein SPPG_03399 [Spizellomyces punctatus DAOM BR117]KND01601.1 hypothetical protein SPPG_03399 [Spizellomyces punctatus DAOM BR117]|eukprot:XP_016609640.1 hypothetical protein SPPG_03399 [Spizellomyces punctatus DAOM BR117]